MSRWINTMFRDQKLLVSEILCIDGKKPNVCPNTRLNQQAHISRYEYSSLYQLANFYTYQLLIYKLQTTYILMSFLCSKGKFSADLTEVFIPDNAMILPRKCNETMVVFNVIFPRFYAALATFSPFINKRLFPLKEMAL